MLWLQHSNRHHPRKRVIQYSRAVAMEPRGRGVLDPRMRGDDDRCWGDMARLPHQSRPALLLLRLLPANRLQFCKYRVDVEVVALLLGGLGFQLLAGGL